MDRREVATGLHDAPDEALLVAFANGDAAAGRALLGRLAPRLFAHAARVLGDRAEAEDVVQETMLRLWKQAPDWRQGEAKVSTWAYRVAVNLCTDRLRARKRRGHVDLDSVPDPPSLDPSAVERMTETVRNTALEAALGTLPDRQRQAVVLRHIEGLSNPEIADALDVPTGTVKTWMIRGRACLKAALERRRCRRFCLPAWPWRCRRHRRRHPRQTRPAQMFPCFHSVLESSPPVQANIGADNPADALAQPKVQDHIQGRSYQP